MIDMYAAQKINESSKRLLMVWDDDYDLFELDTGADRIKDWSKQ